MPPQNTTTNVSTRVGREKVPAGGGAWRLLILIFFVFLVFVFSYLGLVFGYKNFIKAQIENKEEELEELIAQVPQEQQDQFLKFQFQLSNLQSILSKHVIASKILPLIEKNTHSQVFFKNLNLNVSDARIDMQGTAASYEILAQQLNAFQNMPEATSYRIGGARETEGGRVDFDIFLSLKPSVFEP